MAKTPASHPFMHFHDHPIVRDFNAFVAYWGQASSPKLTKSKTSPTVADLLALNGLMHAPVPLGAAKPAQSDFILLNIFFQLGLTAELYRIRHDAKGNPTLELCPARVEVYQRMTDDERYGFLLEAFVCYLDWEQAFENSMVLSFPFATALPVGKPMDVGNVGKLRYLPKSLAIVFNAFGWLEFTTDPAVKPPSKHYLPLKTITLTEIGHKIFGVLKKVTVYWSGRDPRLTPSMEELIYGSADNAADTPPEELDFFEAFYPVFPGWKVEARLFPIEIPFEAGDLTLKISLDAQCYRVICIPAAATFHHLHQAIQHLFHFDHDHMYAFFLNGAEHMRDGNVLYGPEWEPGDEGYPSDLFRLGEVGLYAGRKIRYLFDFGDNWRFDVLVQDVSPAPPVPHSPAVDFNLLESVGKAPKQYQRWS